jgi:transcriptional regulator with XRE-family HTH domain
MDRQKFGRLVEALRKERGGWTQTQLGKKTALSRITIGKIEEGALAKLDRDILVRLADAFQLTTMERREFFLAATAVETKAMSANRTVSDDVLNDLLDLLGVVRTPAYILDNYGDIMAANRAVTALFGISVHLLRRPNVPAQYNIMRLLFDPDLHMQATLGETWDRTTKYTMQFFRRITLRYRFEPYFQNLFSDLRMYPQFEYYWQYIAFELDDNYGGLDFHKYKHQEHGHLQYAITSTTTITEHGELYVVLHTPASAATKDVFDNLDVRNSGLELLAPWPDKRQTPTSLQGASYVYRAETSRTTAIRERNMSSEYSRSGDISIRRIVDPSDPDVPGLLAVYRATIPEHEREPDEELVRYMAENLENMKDPDRSFEEFFIVAKDRDTVVAYLYFTYYPKRGLIFINYLGSDPQLASRSKTAVDGIYDALQHVNMREFRNCRGIVYEIDSLDPTLSQKENELRRARRRLFSSRLRKIGVTDYQVPIDYVQPVLSMRDGQSFEEVPMLLMYAPLTDNEAVLSREEMINIIEATYLEWYGDIYETEPAIQERYVEYLDGLVQRFARSLPDRIALR